MASALPASVAVAVIGAGAMGTGIAQVAAQAGHRVILFDTREAAAAKAVAGLRRRFADLAAKYRITQHTADTASANLAAAESLGDCGGAGLVIEAIAESLTAKRSLVQALDALLDDGAIIASNTSSLSITAIAAGSKHPPRVAGLHFFNPAPLMPLVEIVSGLATDSEVAAVLHATAAAWGKTPVHARSTPGFIVNRCARPFYGEALRLLAERAADVATIDAVMRECGGFRMGPFELMDLVGMDVNFAVTESVWKAYFHDPRFAPSFLQREMVDAGLLGRKSGRGFYDHAADAVAPQPATEAAYPPPQRVVVYGELGATAALVERMRERDVNIEFVSGASPFVHGTHGVVGVGGAWLAQTDGRTATARAEATGARDLVVFDLAFDYATCTRAAVARADSCSDVAYAAAVGALQSACVAVSRLDDVAGLAVMRSVAMLANEACDAAKEGIATPAAIDVAMQKGVNYPRGPLAWADAIGGARVREVLANLAAHYGEDRYRISPWLARRAAANMPLADKRGG
ncbi:MAG: 3-hydroxyacyl-CoA dehydrogenase [Betaproteobacteria bacterium]